MTDLLQTFLNSLQWLNSVDDEKLEIFKECSHRFATGSLSDNKIISISEKHLEISETSLRQSLVSIQRLAINRLQLKNKGPSTIENAVLCSRIVDEKRNSVLELIQEISEIPEMDVLKKEILEHQTKGTYGGSNWRMDIDVAQRTSTSLDPAVTFVCDLQTTTGTQTLCLSPDMLLKLEAELQKAVHAVQKAKTARI